MTESQLRTKVVTIMQSWVGLKESDGSHQKILDIYNGHKPLARGYKMTKSDPWCAATVSAAFIAAGLTDIAPTECSCAKMIDKYKALGRWEESDAYVPSPGDVMMYCWKDGKNFKATDCTKAPDHVGIVVCAKNGKIRVIEGNIKDAVGYRDVDVNGRYIRGFCLPDYSKKAGKYESVKPAAKPAEKPTRRVVGAKSKDPSVKSTVVLRVTADRLNVRSTASSVGTSNIIKVITYGTKLYWYGYYTGDFYLVQLPDKSTGYVHKKYVRR